MTAAAALASCGVDDVYYGEMYDPSSLMDAPYQIDWDAAADSADVALIDNFMDKDRGTFQLSADRSANNQFNYWGQAHAMDVVIDAYLRIKDTDAERAATYEKYMELWHQHRGNNYSSPDYRNDFTDDMEWIVLTLIRMYEATGEKEYLDYAQTTYDEYIITRWTVDENGGGLIWSIESGREISKNACSNGPGALCALRLYEFTQEEKYLDQAKMIYEWLSSTLYDSETGSVADNMKNGVINGGALSYNQGTFIGSAHMLYNFTGDKRYLIEAMRAAEYQMNNMSTDGIMNSEASSANSDNSLFKGIFIRYATLLALDENIDASFRKELSDFMTHNAIVCWTNYDWTVPYTDYYKYYQPQVSGATLIEAMTRLH